LDTNPGVGAGHQQTSGDICKSLAVGGGAALRYLPQYSPELNPIELVFHPLKTALRKAAERTIKGLERRAGSFTRALDPSECMGYFRHAGYEPL
jgi:transposase